MKAEHPDLGLCEKALGRACELANEASHWYCGEPTDNLVASVGGDRWTSIKADLEDGNGSELREKFLAAYSSAALAVNAFGPLQRVVLPSGQEMATQPRFEQRRSAGAHGFPPTLDVIFEPARGTALFVESKCLEYLRGGETDFSPTFVSLARQTLEESSVEPFEAVFEDRQAYGRVDAAQLLKHFLAAKRAAMRSKRRVVLTYVYWEPANANEHSVFGKHRADALQLADALVDSDVEVVPLSYPELWRAWEQAEVTSSEHLTELRQRYEVAI